MSGLHLRTSAVSALVPWSVLNTLPFFFPTAVLTRFVANLQGAQLQVANVCCLVVSTHPKRCGLSNDSQSRKKTVQMTNI